MVIRADKHTQRAAVDELFSDLPVNFDRNPVTGNLSRITNEQAVKSSIVQIVLAMRGEWPHFPMLGSNVYHALFEPIDSITSETIRTVILQALATNEPRAAVARVDVHPRPQEDGYEVNIWFYLVNSTVLHNVTQLLTRIR
jgi:phage baseplate assembly protein W